MKSVLVTGASTGIGAAVTAELARSGFRVWATVRRAEDAERLRAQHGSQVEPMQLDITDEAAVSDAGKRVLAAGPLHGLVNNAGVALPGPLELVPLDSARRQLEVNLVAQLAVTQAMLPALREARKAGAQARIVMIGSVGGRMAGPMIGTYHASKFGLVGLADTLRAELAPSGIRVIMIEPGAIATPIFAKAADNANELLTTLPPSADGHYAAQYEAALAMGRRNAEQGLPPERAARIVVRALTARNPRPRQGIGRDSKTVGALARLLPHRVIYRLAAARA
jgi:NAD(P)-dependent dehydrogenase (short-subunit alcohol dehydrogenase family)